jgi:hypothetical protein
MMSFGLFTNASGAVNATEIRPGLFIDSSTGINFSIDLEAAEGNNHLGLIKFLLKGQSGTGLICSANGPQATLDFNTGIGNIPLNEVQCGTASNMPMTIIGCKARMEFHGYAHIHHPKVTYMGMTTIELIFKKRPEIGKGVIQIRIHTPKNKVILKGVIDSADGVSNIDIASCP